MQDIFYILHWWIVIGIIGIAFLPLTNQLFKNYFDRGYIFSRIIGICIISYISFVFATLKLIPFTFFGIIGIFAIVAFTQFLYFKPRHVLSEIFSKRKIIIFEELLFLLALIVWSYVRAHEPKINGLEKFMDFGFINSLVRTDFLPGKDMWLTPFSINYYYFGHFITAFLTKLSLIPSFITYNLMLATVYALCFTFAFSLGFNLFSSLKNKVSKKSFITGILTALLLTHGGNLHMLYGYFSQYPNDKPLPFFNYSCTTNPQINCKLELPLEFRSNTFPNNYWYPNATRFIPYTIHEFPIYSFVVADLHGHVLDIPLVLLTLALLFSWLLTKSKEAQIIKSKTFFSKSAAFAKQHSLPFFILIALLLACMYMTNAWDGAIYLLIALLVIIAKIITNNEALTKRIPAVIAIIGGFIIFLLPFNVFFKPFVSGVGVLCAPDFLIKLQKLGPFLFESNAQINHCQRSEWWQLLILYGFFYFFVISFVVFIKKTIKQQPDKKTKTSIISKILSFITSLPTADQFIVILITTSTLLLLIPEFFYLKDIYPMHFRANTMFKLSYQAFMMLSITSAYVFIRIISSSIKKTKMSILFFSLYCVVSIFMISLVLTYSLIATQSYYHIPPAFPPCSENVPCENPISFWINEDKKTYHGLDGIAYLKAQNPGDYNAIAFINTKIKGQPVILEAQGDSYTDYGRISANTGLPTILGWTVHEWLWRGEYDYPATNKEVITQETLYRYPARRIEEVKTLYESKDIKETKRLLKKYHVQYVYVGTLERQKYLQLYEKKFEQLGTVAYHNDSVTIYKVND